jgi:hypothetical protein
VLEHKQVAQADLAADQVGLLEGDQEDLAQQVRAQTAASLEEHLMAEVAVVVLA